MGFVRTNFETIKQTLELQTLSRAIARDVGFGFVTWFLYR